MRLRRCTNGNIILTNICSMQTQNLPRLLNNKEAAVFALLAFCNFTENMRSCWNEKLEHLENSKLVESSLFISESVWNLYEHIFFWWIKSNSVGRMPNQANSISFEAIFISTKPIYMRVLSEGFREASPRLSTECLQRLTLDMTTTTTRSTIKDSRMCGLEMRRRKQFVAFSSHTTTHEPAAIFTARLLGCFGLYKQWEGDNKTRTQLIEW